MAKRFDVSKWISTDPMSHMNTTNPIDLVTNLAAAIDLQLDKIDAAIAAGPVASGTKTVAGYVDAGTFLTLDNMKVSVTTGGLRGLCMAAVAGSFQASISGTSGFINGNASAATNYPPPTYTTTPSTSFFGWSFPNAGDGSTYLIHDITNWRMYRVHLMIGPGYMRNFISIEKLYEAPVAAPVAVGVAAPRV